jgi:hypothetical protein
MVLFRTTLSFLFFHSVTAIPFPSTTFPLGYCWLYLLSSSPWNQLALLPPYLFLYLLFFFFSFIFLLFVFYVCPI